MHRRCLCRCHEVLHERWRSDGVDVRDPYAAVTACRDCQNHHAAALSDQPTPQDPVHGASIELSILFQPPNYLSGEDGG